MPEPDINTYEDPVASGRPDAVALKSYLFLILECDCPTAGGARYGLAGIDEVVIGRGTERSATRRTIGGVSRLFILVPGRSMSSGHARIRRSEDGWLLEDTDSTNGSFVNQHRVKRAILRDGDVIELGHTLFFLREGVATPTGTEPDLDSAQLHADPPGFSTLLPAPRVALAALAQIALSAITVLLLGETGTGKEVIARSIHALSRDTGPFVAINCGSLPPNLVESHLFGHARGAFSGAIRDELGAIRSAEGGTLLLDEIGDLPMAAQPALLRFLQEAEVTPVGSARSYKVDVRIIAATHRPLVDLATEGEFRYDLLERLRGFTFALPRLRDRREDLGVIVANVIAKNALATSDASMAPGVGARLLTHDWPGNIRALELTLRRSFVLAGSARIGEEHLHLDDPRAASEAPAAPAARGTARRPAKPISEEDAKLRKELLVQLERYDGNVPEVARALGKARMQIHRWVKRFEIDLKLFRR